MRKIVNLKMNTKIKHINNLEMGHVETPNNSAISQYIKIASNIISYIYHPLIMPMLGVFIIFNSGTYMSNLIPEAKNLIYTLVFVSTFLFPSLIIPFLIWQKILHTVYAETTKERIIPLLLTLIFYYFGYYIISSNNISTIITAYFLSLVISISLTFLINLKWKISNHMVALGGLVGLVIGISLRLEVNSVFLLVSLLFVSGIVGSARLFLNAHNIYQIASGFFLGLSSVMTTMLYY